MCAANTSDNTARLVEETDCPDGSDEMCNNPCVPDAFLGRSIMKVYVLFCQVS